MAAPVLTGPANVSATQGDATALSLSAAGDSPFTYQWYRVGEGYLLNEGTDTLSFAAALLADNGAEFYCIVTDAFDLSTQSANATLTVNPLSTVAPVIIGPTDLTVNAGAEASFNVTVSGTGPFQYQWYLETGGALAGETDRVLTFTTLPADNGKGYRCVVTDISGLVTSSGFARLVVLGDSTTGTADVDYPCGLPGVLVNSNAYRSSDRTQRNSLQSGPPLVQLQDDDGFEMFDVAWSFDAAQVQAFRNWFRFETVSGSKWFNIELTIDGWNGVKRTRTHECIFEGPPSFVLAGKRWHVSATLIALSEQGLDECGSVVAIQNGFPGGIPDDFFPEIPEVPVPDECAPYDCSALLTSLLVAPGIHSVNYFSDTGGQTPGEDETGQGNAWPLQTDASSSGSFILNASTPSSCARNYLHQLTGNYRPRGFVPESDVDWPGTKLAIGAVMRQHADTGSDPMSLLSIFRHRGSSRRVEVLWDRANNKLIQNSSITGAANHIDLTALTAPVTDQWFFLQMYIDLTAKTSRIDLGYLDGTGTPVTGTHTTTIQSDFPTTPWQFGAGISITNSDSTDMQPRFDIAMGWVIADNEPDAAGLLTDYFVSDPAYVRPAYCPR